MSDLLTLSRSAIRVVYALAVRGRRSWRGTLIAGLVVPVLFLLSLGFGLGALLPPGGFGTASYGQFVAPGLLAASSMQFAISEATEPVMAGFKWQRTYDAIIATPVTPGELAAGQLAWIVLKATAAASMFALVSAALGLSAGPSIIIAALAAVGGGAAGASPTMAYAATARTASAFTVLTQFIIVPMTLLSGTFFPLASMPPWLAAIAWCLPLSHAVTLTRALALGTLGPADLAHVAVLAMWLAGGLALTITRFRRRLTH